MLPKKYRLVKDTDFRKIWSQGKAFHTKILNFKLLKNNLAVSRFGIIVGSKISKKSTVRNKIKRCLSEILRLHINQIAPGFDLVINVLPAAVGKNYKRLEKEVLAALQYFKMI